jgi:hypothetical protein
MMQARQIRPNAASERQALRKRIGQMYAAFNDEDWQKCYSMLDPKLRESGKVAASVYAEQLEAFKHVYGEIKPWHLRVSLHLKERNSQQESRPFAYVYVVWQDSAHGFHMFRERWIKHAGHWYTRVAGLVPNQQHSVRNEL